MKVADDCELWPSAKHSPKYNWCFKGRCNSPLWQSQQYTIPCWPKSAVWEMLNKRTCSGGCLLALLIQWWHWTFVPLVLQLRKGRVLFLFAIQLASALCRHVCNDVGQWIKKPWLINRTSAANAPKNNRNCYQNRLESLQWNNIMSFLAFCEHMWIFCLESRNTTSFASLAAF